MQWDWQSLGGFVRRRTLEAVALHFAALADRERRNEKDTIRDQEHAAALTERHTVPCGPSENADCVRAIGEGP
jgi:predicted subunit of tRNA(5-methylaminomethyl-2-thiouridylate) methyltransferase